MLKKGTIYRNCYATLRTYFIYDHTIARTAYGYGLVYIGGKWKLTKGIQYYNIDLINDKNFKPVGKIDIDALIVKAITKEIEKSENPRACKDCVHGKFRKYVLFCEKHNVAMLYEDNCDDFKPTKYKKPIYICDAAKNTKCEKGANCYINGGLCNCTQYIEYARTDEQGKPLEASEI